jgi:hypothetical protein
MAAPPADALDTAATPATPTQRSAAEAGAQAPVFSIVTPCRNAERWIMDTAGSILGQTALESGRARLQYIVCDGASTDRTADLVRAIGDPRIELVSEPDHGMYDALAKGLRRARGEICAYLNAGDLYAPEAFDVVLDAMQSQPTPWVTGLRVVYNERGQMTGASAPFRYRQRLLRRGVYAGTLPHLQQESTFWRTSLNSLIDMEKLVQLRLAGDYYLWYSFAARHEPCIVQAHLGGFRRHRGQLSEAGTEYAEEVRRFAERPGLSDRALTLADALLWQLPPALKKRLSPRHQLRFDHAGQRWQ